MSEQPEFIPSTDASQPPLPEIAAIDVAVVAVPSLPSQLQLQMQTQPEAPPPPKELSESEWRKIMKVDLATKPKVQHPTLGEVVEVAPGILARQVSAEEAYAKHLAAVAHCPMESDEMERKRFSLMISARNNKDADMLASLGTARTKLDLETAIGQSLKKLRGIEHMAETAAVENMFKNNEAEAKQVYEALKKDGRVLPLPPGAVTSEKTLTPDAVAELRRRGVNVFIQRMPGADPYMAKIRADAALATAFAEQRLAAFPNGIGADSSEPERVEFVNALQASAHALSLLDRERDTITRHDGEELAVRVNLAEFYASMKAQHVETKDLREFLHEHGGLIGAQMKAGEQRSSHTLVFLELLDCAVFAPRLFVALAMDPVPRVVEFSRVYNVYRAASTVMRGIPSLLKTRKEIAAIEKANRSELKRKLDEQNGDVTFPHNRKHEEPWMHRHVSVEDVNEEFGAMRLRARTALFESVTALGRWFKAESDYHAAAPAQADVDSYQPTFEREELAVDPQLLVKYFYRNLWAFAQRFAGDLLRAYEFSILLQLHEYVPRLSADFWRSRALLPDNAQCPGVTKKLVNQQNENLTRWRAFSSAAIDSLVAKKIKIDLSFPPAMAEQRVDAQLDWSPTFAQMEKYYRDMVSLFVLSVKQVNSLVSQAAADVSTDAQRNEEAREEVVDRQDDAQ